MIVTIDGPAGAGKSSAARALAGRLGFDYLDTGATFRAVALACLDAALDDRDAAALARLLDSLDIQLFAGRVLINGHDVTDRIRTPAVTETASRLATLAPVRQYLARLQRELARGRNIVCEGRDQGTAVFPDAGCKFFLVADPHERARRRQRELAQRGEWLSEEEVLRRQEERDRRDASRDLAPMVPAPDAILIDSTHLTLDQVVERMEQEVRSRLTD